MRDGWRRLPIADVTSLVRRGKAPAYVEDLGLAVVNQKCIRDGQVDPELVRRTNPDLRPVPEWALLQAGDILVNSTGRGTLGRVGFMRRLAEPMTVDSHVTIVRADRELVEPAFLAYNLINRQQDFEAYASGSTTQTELSRDSIQSMAIDLPPLAEQRRIVDLIESVDAVIDATRRNREHSDRLARALANELIERDTESDTVPLGDVVSFASGYAFPVVHQGQTDGEIPFFKVSDMNAVGNENRLRVAANYVSREVLTDLRAKSWPSGTVVFPKVGAALLTEKRRILATEGAFDNNVMGLVAAPSLTPDYLLAFMRTVRLSEKAQHGAVPSVNQSHLKSLNIPLPPLERQCEIAGAIESTYELGDSFASTLRVEGWTRERLLSDLLSGEHEIPESYDRLLEQAS